MSGSVLFDGLVEDAALRREGALAAEVIASHRGLVDSAHTPVLGPLVVTDRELAEVARTVGSTDPLRTLVINTSGAGGLLSLAQRDHSALDVVAVVSTLRDLDNLAGNAQRVVAATDVLDPAIDVFVGLPRAPGWDSAAEEVEAAGLSAAVDLRPVGGPNDATAIVTQLRDLVELDLPFRVDGLSESGIPLPALLVTVSGLVDDVGVAEATQLITDAASAGATIRGWDDTTAQRVRRRLRSIAAESATGVLDDLVAAGLLDPA